MEHYKEVHYTNEPSIVNNQILCEKNILIQDPKKLHKKQIMKK